MDRRGSTTSVPVKLDYLQFHSFPLRLVLQCCEAEFDDAKTFIRLGDLGEWDPPRRDSFSNSILLCSKSLLDDHVLYPNGSC